MEVTYTLTYSEMVRRFAPPTPLRERITLLLSPLLLGAVAYVNGIRQAIVLDLVVGLFGIACLLTITLWALNVYNGRTNISTICLLEISGDEFLLKADDNSEQRHPWTHLGNIADLGDYLMFDNDRGQHLAVIPKSAFGDENHAQTFLMQSRHYWEAAKQQQQEKMQKAQGTWPPAPRLSNSAEPGDGREG